MASSYRRLEAANSNTFEGFLQHGRRRLKKTPQSWRVPVGISALTDRTRFEKRAPEKPKRKQNLNRNIKNGQKYHEKALARAGNCQLWFNIHFQPSNCFSCSAGV